MAQELVISVTGGYNGGATITMTLDNTTVFTSTTSDTYNQNYNNLSGTFNTIAGEIAVTITPPPTTSSALTITLAGAVTDSLSIMPSGQNTSYGYNYSTNYEIEGEPPLPPGQYDTGLGWSAKSNYLVQTSGTELAKIPGPIGGPSFPGQPLPVATTRLDVITNGVLLYEKTGLDNLRHKFYVASDTSGAVLVADMGSTPASGFIMYRCVTNTPGAKYFMADTANPDYFYEADLSNSVGSGFYSTPGNESTSGGGSDFSLNPQLPAFSNINSFIAAIQTSAASFITKTNAGYGVACYAQWYTQNGTELHSPILISSNSEFTEMTGPSDYNLATFNKLLSGKRFYMSFWDIPATDSLESAATLVDLREHGNLTLEQVFMYIVSTSYAHVIIINSPDPYEEEGAGSGEEGGEGEDLEDDEMGISHHAIPAAINTGFCRIYCPSAQQLRDLSNFLWSAQFDISAVKKLFANPMDSVLGLSAVPLNLSGANAALYLGGVDTQMSLPMVSYQSYQVPMGAITVKERWGSYLDYDPYTKFSIFLPFIGFKDLSADDIMGKQIILDYDVDILSGACTARLQAVGNVLYQWSGQCSIQLPVTASNWNQVFESATSAALSAGLAVATGSAGPVLAGALAAEGAQAIMGKPRIERGGTASGAAGWMGGLTPYLVRVTPEAIIPNEQNKFIGYPAFSSISLGALTGYNEIASIHLEGIPATGAELEELEAILKGGVIF